MNTTNVGVVPKDGTHTLEVADPFLLITPGPRFKVMTWVPPEPLVNDTQYETWVLDGTTRVKRYLSKDKDIARSTHYATVVELQDKPNKEDVLKMHVLWAALQEGLIKYTPTGFPYTTDEGNRISKMMKKVDFKPTARAQAPRQDPDEREDEALDDDEAGPTASDTLAQSSNQYRYIGRFA